MEVINHKSLRKLSHSSHNVNNDVEIIKNFFLACKNGNKSLVKKYRSQISSIQYEKNSEGFVALYYAIYNGLVNTVKILLDHESYMECLDKYGNSILHIACELGYIEIIKYILEKKILNNCKNNNYKTPFQIACQKGYIDIIKLMLQRHDIMIDDIDGDGKTALIMACENNHYSVVKLLINSD
eukprot:jgi/Orpsp1_1/1184096/evm.model.c7180000087991.1